MLPEIFDDFYDGGDDSQPSNIIKTEANESIYLHGTRSILQSITIDPKIETNPVRDAKVLEAMLSTTLPEDTFSILLMHMAQTVEHRRKLKQLHEEIRKFQETTMQNMSFDIGENPEELSTKPTKRKINKKEKIEQTDNLSDEPPSS